MAPSNTMLNSPEREVSTDIASSASTPPAKRQPWRAVWPAPREDAPKVNVFGFAKGETMVFDGNAGNFFVKDSWSVEQESTRANGS